MAAVPMEPVGRRSILVCAVRRNCRVDLSRYTVSFSVATPDLILSQVIGGGVGWSVVAGLVAVVYFGARLKAVRVCLDLALTVPIKSRMPSMPPVAQSVISPLTLGTQSTPSLP